MEQEQFIQDYNNFHKNLINLKKLKTGAIHQGSWDRTGWHKNEISPENKAQPSQKEWNPRIVTEINWVSSQINKATASSANVVVVSSEMESTIYDLEHFLYYMGDKADAPEFFGMKSIGTLSGRYTVYVNRLADAKHVLVGRKEAINPFDFKSWGLVTIDNIKPFTTKELR